VLNIQNTVQIPYGNSKNLLTVYGDSDNSNLKYILPTPVFAETNGVPEFSLQEFQTDQGISGTCSFIAELVIPEAALKAFQEHFPQAELGQLDWMSAQSYFKYKVGIQTYTLNAVPARYDRLRAAFVIDLPNQLWVDTFKTSFHGTQQTNVFSLEYNTSAWTNLPAVDVLVKYDSKIAFDYQKSVQIDKNVWGRETSRRETIKETLQNSDCGTVDINWHSAPPPGLEQQVTDWAWVTLETLVQNAVDDAIRFLGEKNADQISMSATSSFERRFTQNQIIEFAAVPKALVPAFDDATWAKVYSKGDVRRLSCTFTIMDDLAAAKINSVEVTVEYPNATENTHTFDRKNVAAWKYSTDGTRPFDPNFSYRYKVIYEGGNEYTSPSIPAAQSSIVLNLAELGIQTATFVAANLDFAKSIDFVIVDFFYNMPDGKNKHEVFELRSNLESSKISSRTFLPSTNEYTYQLTYVMKDGTTLVAAPTKNFPPQNNDNVVIVSPFEDYQFYLSVINPSGPSLNSRITRVQVTATYNDPVNNFGPVKHVWNYAPPSGEEFSQAPPWELQVPRNPGGYMQYEGNIITNKIIRIQDVRSSDGFINLSYNQIPFTAAFDPFQIDWTKVSKVQVDLFRQIKEGDPEDRTDILSLQFMEPPLGKASEKQYYTFLADLIGSVAEVEYFWSATYYHAEGADTYVKESGSDLKSIVLPKDGTALTLTVNRAVATYDIQELSSVDS
jgi:hypothetical protein